MLFRSSESKEVQEAPLLPIPEYVQELVARARQAAGRMASLSTAVKNTALLAMADALMEIALGDLVQKQGSSPIVKDLGHRMVADHTAIKLILAKAATGTAATLPTQLDADQQAVLSRLSALSGADLDREYLWEQTIRQPRSVTMYRWQYENCDDKRLKAFAVGTLPIIVVHGRVADEAHKKLNAEEIALQDRRAEIGRAHV